MNPSATLRRPALTPSGLPGLPSVASVAARAAQVAQAARQAMRPAPGAPGTRADARGKAHASVHTDADKGSKEPDGFEVWHHHQSVRDPAEFDLMVKLDERR
jgi:hypothetical protein